jgi:hypothetical protein
MFTDAVADRGVIIVHPNRDKPAVKATKAAVILLLLVSAGLMGIVAVGGWSALAGQKPSLIAYILIYLILAFYAARWNRGVLPVAAALAIILDLRGRVRAAVVRARQGGLRGSDAERRPAGVDHLPRDPGPGPVDRIRDARLPAGLARRGRAARGRRAVRPRRRAAATRVTLGA